MKIVFQVLASVTKYCYQISICCYKERANQIYVTTLFLFIELSLVELYENLTKLSISILKWGCDLHKCGHNSLRKWRVCVENRKFSFFPTRHLLSRYCYTCCVSWPALGCFFKCVFLPAFGCLTKYTDIYSRYLHTSKFKILVQYSDPICSKNFVSYTE